MKIIDTTFDKGWQWKGRGVGVIFPYISKHRYAWFLLPCTYCCQDANISLSLMYVGHLTKLMKGFNRHYFTNIEEGLPRWPTGKESTCQCRRHKKLWFNSQVRKTPWRRKWQPTPAWLPRQFCGQRKLVDYSPQVLKESDTTE